MYYHLQKKEIQHDVYFRIMSNKYIPAVFCGPAVEMSVWQGKAAQGLLMYVSTNKAAQGFLMYVSTNMCFYFSLLLTSDKFIIMFSKYLCHCTQNEKTFLLSLI